MMKIKHTEKDAPGKLWHRKAGDVVRLHDDATEPEGREFFLVIRQSNSGTYLFNLTDNQYISKSCSVRCTHYPKAQLIPGDFRS